MSSLEQIKKFLSERSIEESLTSMALAYLVLNKEVGKVPDVEEFNNLMEMNLFLPEEEIQIKMMEDMAANNTAGVEVKNPDAVPKKKKTVKDFLARRA